MIKHTDLRFGVEVETERGGICAVRNAVARGLGVEPYRYNDTDVIDQQGRVWQVKSDGSLHNFGAEMVTPPLTVDDLPTLRAVLHEINTNTNASATEACGLHIHVDAALFSGAQIANLCTLIYGYEAHIYKALAVSDHRRTRWTKPQTTELVDLVRKEGKKKDILKERLGSTWYGQTGTRYYGVNLAALCAHGTIEFRYFDGTTNPDNIEAYVHFVLALAAYALNKRSVAFKQQKALVEDCARFDFRCLLVHLGLNGDDYKMVRKVLTRNLGGNNRRAVGRTCTAHEAYESLPTVRAARAATG